MLYGKLELWALVSIGIKLLTRHHFYAWTAFFFERMKWYSPEFVVYWTLNRMPAPQLVSFMSYDQLNKCLQFFIPIVSLYIDYFAFPSFHRSNSTSIQWIRLKPSQFIGLQKEVLQKCNKTGWVFAQHITYHSVIWYSSNCILGIMVV